MDAITAIAINAATAARAYSPSRGIQKWNDFAAYACKHVGAPVPQEVQDCTAGNRFLTRVDKSLTAAGIDGRATWHEMSVALADVTGEETQREYADASIIRCALDRVLDRQLAIL